MKRFSGLIRLIIERNWRWQLKSWNPLKFHFQSTIFSAAFSHPPYGRMQDNQFRIGRTDILRNVASALRKPCVPAFSRQADHVTAARFPRSKQARKGPLGRGNIRWLMSGTTLQPEGHWPSLTSKVAAETAQAVKLEARVICRLSVRIVTDGFTQALTVKCTMPS